MAGCIATVVLETWTRTTWTLPQKSVAIADLGRFISVSFALLCPSFLRPVLPPSSPPIRPLMNSVMLLILPTRSRHAHPSQHRLQSCSFAPAFLYTTSAHAHHRCDISIVCVVWLLSMFYLLHTHTLSLCQFPQLTFGTVLLPTLATLPHCPHTFLRITVFARNPSISYLPTLPSFPSMGQKQITLKIGTALAPTRTLAHVLYGLPSHISSNHAPPHVLFIFASLFLSCNTLFCPFSVDVVRIITTIYDKFVQTNKNKHT